MADVQNKQPLGKYLVNFYSADNYVAYHCGFG